MNHKRIICDKTRCSGCYACISICLNQHYKVEEKGVMRRRVIKEEDPKRNRIYYYSKGCYHCPDASCLTACPTQAIYRDPESHMVLLEEEACIGCQACFKACPFDIPTFKNKKMVKCDGCSDRIKENLQPLCVQTCPTGALEFK